MTSATSPRISPRKAESNKEVAAEIQRGAGDPSGDNGYEEIEGTATAAVDGWDPTDFAKEGEYEPFGPRWAAEFRIATIALIDAARAIAPTQAEESPHEITGEFFLGAGGEKVNNIAYLKAVKIDSC